MQLLNRNICLLGASFSTGNLGVSALGWSSIRLLLEKWPDACIEIVGSNRSQMQSMVVIGGRQLKVNVWPVRFCSNPLVSGHFWKLLLGTLLVKAFPFLRSIFAKQQSTFGAICRADVIADITGGDSFSDIYGMKRFILGYLTKRLCQMTGKPFVMLPQTYGPFKSSVARFLARRVLKKTVRIYSRDKEGMTSVKGLIGDTDKVTLSPDVAFVMDAKEPQRSTISDGKLANFIFKDHQVRLIGLNVSGLLFNGGYTGNNQFALKCNYRDLVESIIRYFADLPNTNVLLVPHVVSENLEVENDLIACRKILDGLTEEFNDKVFIAEPDCRSPFFDQCEIKYIIGKCNFFLGSRMHATIAAISQCIPTVGLAYSKKFAGVYETVGVEDCVVDLRDMENGNILDRIKALYENNQEIKQRLEKNIPAAKQKLFYIFNNL